MLKKKLFTGICLLSLLSGCVLDDLHDCPGHPDKPVLPNSGGNYAVPVFPVYGRR